MRRWSIKGRLVTHDRFSLESAKKKSQLPSTIKFRGSLKKTEENIKKVMG